MKTPKTQAGLGILALLFFWAGTANASTLIPGTAVASPGSETMVGSLANVHGIGEKGTADAIKYFIPLESSYNGVYGVISTNSQSCSAGAGTCSNTGSGSGSGYDNADALKMNIGFDTNSAQAQSASLSLIFEDLDLIGQNDPIGFFESISLSYWNWNGTSFDADPHALSNGTIKEVKSDGGPKNTASPSLVTWKLDISDINALNMSSQDKGGYWIQLGFGTDFNEGNSIGQNTPEFLAAQLNVSAVPVPAAFWLFGTALVGFIGISRRTKV